MKSIARTIRPTQKYLLRQFYSASSDRSAGKMSSVQPVDIQTQDEIDFEVSIDAFVIIDNVNLVNLKFSH